jgi:hypothetical protein
MSDNERGFHHPGAIDKPITRGVHDINHVPHRELSGGITGAPMRERPHDAGPRAPVHIAPSAARPANDMGPGLLPANGAINPDPHPYNPATQVQQRNTYAAPTWESKFK